MELGMKSMMFASFLFYAITFPGSYVQAQTGSTDSTTGTIIATARSTQDSTTPSADSKTPSTDSTIQGSIVTEVMSTPDSTTPDHCGGPCNNGSCVNGTCQCNPGYFGQSCDQGYCDTTGGVCENGGTCTNNDAQAPYYACECVPGYSGANCTEDVDECSRTGSDYPCDRKNGNCTNFDGGYNCTCNLGFEFRRNDSTDSMCYDVNECSPNPCQQGGTCHDMINDYDCTCPTGYSGNMCETDIDGCDPNPCNLNNTVMCNSTYSESLTYECVCAGGWEGDNCTEDIRDCNSSVCLNGATCIDLNQNYTCDCTAGYIGRTCGNVCEKDKYFGQDCMQDCTCVSSANCSNVDGMCECKPAFSGAVCDKSDLEVNISSAPNVVFEGDLLTLKCHVNLPEMDLMTVAWFKDEERFDTSSDVRAGVHTTNISNVNFGNSGAYYCEATAKPPSNNSFQRSETLIITVIVNGRIVSIGSDRVKLEESSTLNCTVFSSEMSTVQWQRNGTTIESNGKTNITGDSRAVTVGSNYTYTYSLLTVSNVVRDDNGTYVCVALDSEKNVTDEEDFSIVVLEIAELSHAVYTQVEAEKLTISWNVLYDGNAGVDDCVAYYNSSTDERNMTVGSSAPGIITGLAPFTTYSVFLICSNEVGPSGPLNFPDKQTFKAAPDPPRNVTVDEKTKTSARVSWQPPLTTNGPVDGYTVYAERQRCSDSCLTDPQTVDGDTRTLDIDLAPGIHYVAVVEAFNIEDRMMTPNKLNSTKAISGMFTTMHDKSTAPIGVTTRVDNDEECVVEWNEPNPTNGDITKYKVYIQVFRIDNGELDNIFTEEEMGMQWSKPKSQLDVYSIFKISVSAFNEAGEGDRSDDAECHRTTVGTPALPLSLPVPPSDSITASSFTIELPPYDTRNGPVSCYAIIVVQVSGPSVMLDSNAAEFHPDKIKRYDEAKDEERMPYRALVMQKLPSDNIVTIGSKDKTDLSCDTRIGPAGSGRGRRASTTGSEISARNGDLKSARHYSVFLRVYSPTGEADNVYFTNGAFSQPVRTKAQPTNPGPIIGAVFAVIIVACIAVILVIFLRRRYMAQDDQLVNSTNTRVENGHNMMGMVNIGIEDVEEMIVKPIPLENLEAEIRRKSQDEKKIFWTEYKALPNRPPPMVTVNASNHQANKDKNRYINIIAYDHTRVQLKTIDGIEGSDYINASYVNGYQSPDKFIAAQGPKDNTIHDFWRMIWEQNSTTIVMLTKCVEDGKDKCSQYWPDKGSARYGNFVVTMDTVKETAEYVIRSFFLHEASNKDQQRSITQFHFHGWPDHGQPDYPNPMLCLIKRVRHLTSRMNKRANIVIHCSAGVGRTGTYIVIDAMMDQMKNEKSVDIYNFIHEIRQQRNTLVQSFVQYFFIHWALLENYKFGHTDISVSSVAQYYQQLNKTANGDNSLSNLEQEFRNAAKLPVNKTEQNHANIEQNKEKNRIGHILPYDKNIVKLDRLIGVEFSDYINASYITGFQRKEMYIATQGPLPNTVGDFWRMVWGSQTSTIVMLTEISQRGQEMCSQYWPTEVGESMKHGDFTVTLQEESDEGEFTIRDLEITCSQVSLTIYGNIGSSEDGESALYGNVTNNIGMSPESSNVRHIRQYHYRGWPEVGVPQSGLDLVHLVNKVHQHQSDCGPYPIVVHCSAGAGRTGVFLALSILMERIAEESMVDVFQTVRSLRQQRPHMVQDLAQYKLCYSSIVEYVDSQSNEYQNFVPRV